MTMILDVAQEKESDCSVSTVVQDDVDERRAEEADMFFAQKEHVQLTWTGKALARLRATDHA
jgi:hypothetical protein